MTANVAVLAVGLVIGFVTSRQFRRVDRAAQVASAGRAVGGTVGRRRGLTPPELQRACFSEMMRHVQVTRQGRTHAPSSYVLLLHPDDVAMVDESRRWFIGGLESALRRAAGDNGWHLTGDIVIETETASDRRPGVPAALAVHGSGSGRERAAAPPTNTRSAGGQGTRTLVVVRSDTEERFPLGSRPLTIGRARDRDITIDDNRVSRSHARIEPRNGGWTVVDEGSANGTRLRGDELPPQQPRPLRAGDLLGIGPVELLVKAGPPASEGLAGTRALDASDRTRISGQVLPGDDLGRPR